MCGIAGILNVAAGAAPARPDLTKMIGALAHRGPDGFGYYNDADVGLAHARLSIIDLAGGGQPIHNEDGSVQVVFNGEIFNYIELRRDLEAQGHSFYTHSDTEVIVHLYEQYGLDFVRHLNGQFAIALWDKRERSLILTRDRVGIRPLFYTHSHGRLLFASEIKALFTDSKVERSLSLGALGQIFTYWAPLAPATAFENIFALPPGHTLRVRNGRTQIVRYWDWEFPTHAAHKRDTRTAAECLDGLRERLIESVRLQVRADVPVGAYLSGGLDSSLIAALLKKYTDVPLRTFSLRFADAEFDESDYQQEMVRHLGTHHTDVYCERADIRDAFIKMVRHTEIPVLRTAAVPLMLLSQSVRAQGYKVVLTGEGADEVMGGYDIFKEGKVRRFWARDPVSTLRPRLFERLYPYLLTSPTASPAYARRFFGQDLDRADAPYFGHMPRWQTTSRIWQFFSGDALAQLQGFDAHATLAATLPPAIANWHGLNQDQYVEAHTLLSGYLLCSQGDRMAMANSIEGRFPFLDHHFIEYCNALPPRYKLMGLTEKYLLKQLGKELLPERIRARPKQPYRAPDIGSFFIAGETAEYVTDLLSDTRLREQGYFDVEAVRKLVAKARAGRAIGFSDNMAFVALLSTMVLDDQFIRAKDDAPGRASAAPLEGHTERAYA